MKPKSTLLSGLIASLLLTGTDAFSSLQQPRAPQFNVRSSVPLSTSTKTSIVAGRQHASSTYTTACSASNRCSARLPIKRRRTVLQNSKSASSGGSSRSSPSSSLGLEAAAYMALLALQFGLQPGLVRKFTPQTICRSTVVMMQEILNVTMEPGDLVLYESHSIVHGRPYPLKGRFFANVFIHFQPVLEDFDAMPKYIIPGSPEAKKWERENAIQKFAEGKSNEAHRMAAQGDLRGLQAIARSERSREILFQADENGWTPLHEAARGGKVDALQLLLEEGADADARVAGGKSALHIAREAKHEEDSEIIVKVLKEAGCGSDIW